MGAVRTRKMTTAQAVAAAEEYCQCMLRVIAQEARTDAEIAELKATMVDRTEADRERMRELKPTALTWLLANKEEICAGRRKSMDTPIARLGFRRCTDTVIEDPDAVLDFARAHGYADLYTERDPKVSKSAVRKRITRGEDIPGAHLDSDDEPFVEPQKTLVDQAKRGEY